MATKTDSETALELLQRCDPSISGVYPLDTVASFDHLLCGGVHAGQLTELIGDSATGKTQFCYALLANNLLRSGQFRAVWLDATVGFRARRLAEVLTIKGRETGDQLQALLDRVFIRRALDSDELLEALKAVYRLCRRRGDISLVIIDSIGMALYTTVFLDDFEQCKRLQQQVIDSIRRLTDDYAVAVLAVNHVVESDNGQSVPALGRMWAQAADQRILFEKPANLQSPFLNRRRVRLLPSPGKLQMNDDDDYAEFFISRAGLVKV